MTTGVQPGRLPPTAFRLSRLARLAPPERVPTAAAAVLALVRRDLAQRRIVKFALALDLLFGTLNLVVFEFIGRVLRDPAAGPVIRAGGYFSFASVGIAFFLVIQTATTGITRQIRDEQYSGSLELVAAQPVGPAHWRSGSRASRSCSPPRGHSSTWPWPPRWACRQRTPTGAALSWCSSPPLRP